MNPDDGNTNKSNQQPYNGPASGPHYPPWAQYPKQPSQIQYPSTGPNVGQQLPGQQYQGNGTPIPVMPHQLPPVPQNQWPVPQYQGVPNPTQVPYGYPYSNHPHTKQQYYIQQSPNNHLADHVHAHQVQPEQQGVINTYQIPSSTIPSNLPPNGYETSTPGTNILKHPVPPYAIATTNDSNLTRTRASPEAVPSGGAKKGFRNSRRRHRNSHLGCATCKARRIKCDEQLRACHNCVRARLTCAYLSLDNAAIEALRAAQKAHAARIERLNSQESARYAEKSIMYPYHSEGLPSKIFTPPPPNGSLQYPTNNIQINLQRPSFQMHPSQQQQFPPQFPASPPIVTQPSSDAFPQTSQRLPSQTSSYAPSSSTTDSTGSSSHLISTSSQSSTSDIPHVSACSATPSPISPEIKNRPRMTLGALIRNTKSKKGIDNLREVDADDVEIVLDPDCTKHLNKYWTDYDEHDEQQSNTFDEEKSSYKEYYKYHESLVKEAQNNIVLFKSLISHGAVLINQFSKNKKAKEIAKKRLEQDFEITLRFLNKFKINFTNGLSSIYPFYLNVNLSFSKFQIFQTALYTTVYGPHTFKDNIELSNRMFNFIISYLNNEFTVFLDQESTQKFKEDRLFKRATLFNNHIHMFIKHYAQCVKSYHTRPYNPLFMEELHEKFKAIKPFIYDKLPDQNKTHYDDLDCFLTDMLKYWRKLREENVTTNRVQVIFYTMKKLLSILPSESHVPGYSQSFEVLLLFSYFQAVTAGLKAIFSETRFYFVFSFSGFDDTKATPPGLGAFESDKITNEQHELLGYPVKVIQFFKQRALLISQFLSGISNFPAKITLDDQNKAILMNLVHEDQLKSFIPDIKESSYPHIDRDSSFYKEETNSIVIPSVLTTKSFSNFETSQMKRFQIVTESVNQDLTAVDQELINSFFKNSEGNMVSS